MTFLTVLQIFVDGFVTLKCQLIITFKAACTDKRSSCSQILWYSGTCLVNTPGVVFQLYNLVVLYI